MEKVASAHSGRYFRPMSNPLLRPTDRPESIVRWLLIVAALVFAMVVVGGITRLTESGLSITEWKPITGAIPPLNEQVWQAEFEKYQQIPEYLEVKGPRGMTMADFKFIYFWEWVHRQLGRLIGLAFALPLLWFWLRKQIPAGYKPRLLGLLFLGSLQGFVGWWMVVSGLTERTEVSHFRLAVHLLLALIILAALVWTALNLHILKKGATQKSRFTPFSICVLAILFFELLLGALVAGLRAGHVSNRWPMMFEDHFFPPGLQWSMELIRSLPNHSVLLHFTHRWWAWVVVIFLIFLARRIRKTHRKASIALHSAFGTQILLGIATVLTNVNISLAVLHQAVAALVVISTIWCAHILGRSKARYHLPEK